MPDAKRMVVVLGASDKRERHSNKAIRLLKSEGFGVIPVHPILESVEGFPVVRRLADVREPVDTLALYVNPSRSIAMADEIVALRPGRVLFSPGSESTELQTRLSEAGIPFLEACALVMLSTGQF
jgi:uncharacterized protein